MANCTRLERVQCQHGAYCETFSVHDDPNECWKLKQQQPPTPMTNADRILAMTDEELAELFSGMCKNSEMCDTCPMDGNCPGGSTDFNSWLQWLQQTAED